MTVKFTWDPAKAGSNLTKHGVTFEEAVSVFGDALALFAEDWIDERRTILMGVSERQRLILVVHEEIEDSVIRIISARRASSNERRRHEEGP